MRVSTVSNMKMPAEEKESKIEAIAAEFMARDQSFRSRLQSYRQDAMRLRNVEITTI